MITDDKKRKPKKHGADASRRRKRKRSARAPELFEDDVHRRAGLALLQRLADAHDHAEAVEPRVRDLLPDRGVVLSEERPAFAVPEDDPRHAHVLEHLRADLC